MSFLFVSVPLGSLSLCVLLPTPALFVSSSFRLSLSLFTLSLLSLFLSLSLSTLSLSLSLSLSLPSLFQLFCPLCSPTPTLHPTTPRALATSPSVTHPAHSKVG